MTLQLTSSQALEGMVAVLEEDVVFGRLHPRERLVEDDLMSRFAVKRHVAREALASLEKMGLVERRKNVGACVRFFTTREVVELYEVRTLLEVEAARTIDPDLSPARLEALVAIQRQHDQAIADADVRAVFRHNLAFHRELFSLSNNQTLSRAVSEFARQTHPIRFASLVSAGHRERAQREHWAMIDALRRGDITALCALCSEHLQPSRDAYLAAQSHIGTGN